MRIAPLDYIERKTREVTPIVLCVILIRIGSHHRDDEEVWRHLLC